MLNSSVSPASKGPMDFTTSLYSEPQGFAYWRDVICTYLSPSETARVFPNNPFAASLRKTSLGKAGICEIRFSPMRNYRDANCLRRMPDDDIFVAFMKSRGAKLTQDKRCAAPDIGDVVVYDSARPFEWHFDTDSQMLIARISRRQMIARLPKIEALTATVIKAQNPLASIVGNTMGEMLRFDGQLDDRCAHRLGNSFIEMLSSSIEAALMSRVNSPVDRDLLTRAKTYLLDHIEDPDLDLHQLTASLGVSLRTLCRAFAADGTTAIKWLWQQRLDLAHQLLSQGQVKNVSQVVMQCGFNDFSHFSRTFRKAYGVMPRSVLRQAMLQS